MLAADHQHIVSHGPYAIHITRVSNGPLAPPTACVVSGSQLVAHASIRLLTGPLAGLGLDGISVWKGDHHEGPRVSVTFPTWDDPKRAVPTYCVSFHPSYGSGVLQRDLSAQITGAYAAAVQADLNRLADAMGE